MVRDRDERLVRLGERLRRARLDKALTQENVAVALGTSRRRYNRIEQGIVEPKVGELERLCVILDAPLTMLLAKNESIGFSSGS